MFPVFCYYSFFLPSQSFDLVRDVPLDVFPLRVYMHNVLFFTVSFVLYA